MANPVLSRPDAFVQRAPAGSPTFTPAPWQSPGGQPAAYQQPYAYGQPAPGQSPQAPAPTPTGRMTIDDVLTKTALILGAVVVMAVLSWRLLGDRLDLLAPVAIVCGLAAFIIPMVGAFRRSVGPVFAFVYAIAEGIFLGAISGLFELYYPGIIFQAVIATFVAAGATLAAFHFGQVRLTGKVRKVLFISLLAFAGVALVNLILYFCGINLGLIAGITGDVSALAWLFAGVGVVLAVVSLVDDFQFIETAVQQGAPAKTSWVAAYGLSVTMVFLYINILRLLSYIRR
ncbi:MAG: Bax inhibitor-1/YccA family protein [Propionibacteriaceae bacterium]|jgi:uncharacterized YccA/Bax inhibitor family protein|nr:Bax inhibitor-1/YccA family protein [Propionibacteriaceae bacterium]